MRLLIHSGFHKTGTTSLQHGLRNNRTLLEPHLRLALYEDMTPTVNAARDFSADRTADKLRRFCMSLHKFLKTLDPNDPRPVAVSSEDLCGHMPGREGLTSYTAAPILMRALTMTTLETLGQNTDLTVMLSLRAPESWLKSCYAQHLRVIRMTDPWKLYAEAYRTSADLNAIADRVQAQIGNVPLIRTQLEDSRSLALGPMTPLLNALDLPQDVQSTLQAPNQANPKDPQELQALYLEANRSDMSDKDVRDAKVAARRIWMENCHQA